MELIGALSIGSSLIMLRPNGTRDTTYFIKALQSNRATFLFLVPSLISITSESIDTNQTGTMSYSTFDTVRVVLTGGEMVSWKHVEQLYDMIPLTSSVYNFYAPAECTVAAIYHKAQLKSASPFRTSEDSNVPLGKTLLNRRAYILDEYLQSTAINQIGELYIGGLGIFQGYLNRPDLTDKVLVELPSYITSDRRKYYKTGDLVKLNAKGEIVFIGRKDFQIKLRGQRIETGEIESVILKFSTSSIIIQNSLVTKVKDEIREQDYLVAYIQYSHPEGQQKKLQNGEIEKQIKDHCEERLPQYMVPSFFIFLTEFPLNQNGKVDRKLLPSPNFSALITATGENYIEPQTELELCVHKIWCDILKQQKLSMDASLFALGGNSLLMIQLLNRYRTTFGSSIGDLNISQLFKHPTLQEHVNLLSLSTTLISADDFIKNDSKRAIPIQIHRSTESDRFQPFPLTEIQQAYLIGRSNYFELGNVSVYSYREYDCVASTFDIQGFEQALNKIIRRHEAFRTRFLDETRQQILNEVPYYVIKILDLSIEITDASLIQQTLIDRRKVLSHKILSASEWPLFDIQLTRWSPHDLRLHIGIDGLILDALSLTIFWKELLQLYSHPELTLPNLELSIRDYILSLETIKDLPIYKEDEAYWVKRLSTFPLGGPDLPLAKSPKEIKLQTFRRATSNLEINLWQMLQKSLQKLKITPVSLLVSLYANVLNKWSNQQHFVINLPLFNRLPLHPQINDVLGEFTSILPLEIDFRSLPTSTKAGDLSFGESVQRIQNRLWEDLDHGTYSGLKFFRELAKRRTTGHAIIYPVVFTSVLGMEKAILKTGTVVTKYEHIGQKLRGDPVYAITQTPQVWLDYKSYENDKGELVIEWDYVSDLFPPNMIQSMHEIYCYWLKDLAKRFNDIWQQSLPFRLPEEQLQRRNIFEQTYSQALSDSVKNHHLLHKIVLEQAKTRSPEAQAVLSERGNLTYKQLINRSTSLAKIIAKKMKQDAQIQNSSLCAILMEKGWEQVVACLSILMSGQAFLPLDIESPVERLISLIKEAQCQIILTQQDHVDLAKDLSSSTKIIVVDDEEIENTTNQFLLTDETQQANNLAYVIYTSGSTGKPKGVAISHEAVINTLLDINDRFTINCDDRIFALSHLNFDLAIYDIFGILIAGGTIVIPDQKDYKNPERWHTLIVEHKVTIWNSVPMLMKMYVEYLEGRSALAPSAGNDFVVALRHILLSGDRIPISLPAEIYRVFGQTLELTSLGGATEASIWSIVYPISPVTNVEWKSSIPYGKPLTNQKYYVFDSQLDPCPDYVIGELYIGGRGLALGYYKDEEKTKKSFFQHPRNGEHLYKTGDLGRFIPAKNSNDSGYIEFSGRQDFQVKLHGHRIELGEIEYHLHQHPSIEQAVVDLMSSDSNDYNKNSMELAAFIVPKRPYKTVIELEENNIATTIIKDSTEKENFKYKRYGLLQNQRHNIKFDQYAVQLIKTTLTDAIIDSYFERKSYRQFLNDEKDQRITKPEVESLLKSTFSMAAIDDSLATTNILTAKSFNVENLSKFLSYLMSISVSNDQSIPKYRYPSADSLYPIQVYVIIPQVFDDLLQFGLYYYHPDEHMLLKIQTPDTDLSKKLTSNQMLFQIYLVGRLHSIAPIHGSILAREFCLLETGYIYGLLRRFTLKELGWEIKLLTTTEMSQEQHIMKNCLQLTENDTFCSFAIQLVSPRIQSIIQSTTIDIKKTQSNKNGHSSINIWLYFKPTKEWLFYNKQTGILQCAPQEFIFNEIKHMELGQNGIILNDCSLAIFFTGEITKKIESKPIVEAGMLSQLLMDEAIKSPYNIGMCPIGASNFIEHVNDSLYLLTSCSTLQQQYQPQKVLHTLLLGRVSVKQKYDRLPSEINRLNEQQLLTTYLSKFLPDYMIPKYFLLIEQAPLNQNGKVDRKELARLYDTKKPRSAFETNSLADAASVFSTPTEQLLWKIFIQAFEFLDENIHVNTEVTFYQLGASSLQVIKALGLIRQELDPNLDFQTLLSNPSVERLASVLDSRLKEKATFTSMKGKLLRENKKVKQQRSEPSFSIELAAVFFLIFTYALPVLVVMQFKFAMVYGIWNTMVYAILVPSLHLLQYIMIKKVLFGFSTMKDGEYLLFSWEYYRFWFLNRLWLLNAHYLQFLLGTPFYNVYLRLCGARIGRDCYLFTTFIDAVDSIDIGDNVIIQKDVVLHNVTYETDTFHVSKIKIDSFSTIDVRSVLYGEVHVMNNVLIKSMSSVTKSVSAMSIVDGDAVERISTRPKKDSVNDPLTQRHDGHVLCQFFGIVVMLVTHAFSILLTYQTSTYGCIGIILCPIVYMVASSCLAISLLFFLIGRLGSGTYKLDSFTYLYKIWLRDLITNTFHQVLSFLPETFQHCMGASIGQNVQIGAQDALIGLPGSSNLLKIDDNVTINCKNLLYPLEMTYRQECLVDRIHIGKNCFIANMVTIHSGGTVHPGTTVGSMTRITSETMKGDEENRFFLGVPARSVHLKPLANNFTDALPFLSSTGFLAYRHLVMDCLSSSLKTLLSLLFIGMIILSFIHLLQMTNVFCLFTSLIGFSVILHIMIEKLRVLSTTKLEIHEEYVYRKRHRFLPDINIMSNIHQLTLLVVDHFFGGTQWLVIFLRLMGCKIGRNVIINDFSTILDPQLIQIGDNVRIGFTAVIQAHTYEKREFQLLPVAIGSDTILMSGSLIHLGCQLDGNNCLYPLTFLMKNDHLSKNTKWIGSPARLISDYK
ncbi:unnamed protein product [Rotaria socialis]|nr:unnamed protein product [Rotaria socialis]